MVSRSHLERALAAHGLRLRGGFVPATADALPALPGGAAPAVVWMVGQVGSEVWPHFSAAPFLRDGLPDPLDRWSKSTGTALAAAQGGLAIFPLFPELQAQLGIGTGALGVMAAASFLAALTAELLLAPQADRGHARAMAVTGILVVAASLAASAAATEVWQLVIARAITGLGAGLFMPAACWVTVPCFAFGDTGGTPVPRALVQSVALVITTLLTFSNRCFRNPSATLTGAACRLTRCGVRRLTSNQ